MTETTNVEELRFFFHTPFKKRGKHVRPRVTLGGFIKDGILRIGAAKCWTDDNFARKTGREMALQRADSKDQYLYLTDVGNKPEEKSLGQWFHSVAAPIADLVYKGKLKPSIPLQNQENNATE